MCHCSQCVLAVESQDTLTHRQAREICLRLCARQRDLDVMIVRDRANERIDATVFNYSMTRATMKGVGICTLGLASGPYPYLVP
jgi:hypothetical protein